MSKCLAWRRQHRSGEGIEAKTVDGGDISQWRRASSAAQPAKMLWQSESMAKIEVMAGVWHQLVMKSA